jgi:hypothetical protein
MNKIAIIFFVLIGCFSFTIYAQTGIGTTTPAVKLHVKSNGSIFRLEGTDHAYMEWYPQGASTRFGWFGYPSANAIDLTIASQYATGSLVFNTNNAERLRINASGNVGIGTNNPTVSLQVSGDIIANSIAGSSDARFKYNILPIENPLQKVQQLRGVTFDWKTKEFPSRMFSENRAVGFIAQEVEQVLPEVVQTEKTTEGYKSVQYDKVVALLVEAIKEQQKQIEVLQKEIKKIKKRKK